MSLIVIEADAETIGGLHDVEGLAVVDSSVDEIAPDAFRIAAYALEDVYPELEGRGCRVEIVMTSGELDEYHQQMAAAFAPPDGLG
jgi:hypothetical protein